MYKWTSTTTTDVWYTCFSSGWDNFDVYGKKVDKSGSYDVVLNGDITVSASYDNHLQCRRQNSVGPTRTHLVK